MTEQQRFFTLVYEYTPEFEHHNPFRYETPWGSAIGYSIGDAMHEAKIYEEALLKIRNGSPDAKQIAEKVLDDIYECRRNHDFGGIPHRVWRLSEAKSSAGQDTASQDTA